MAAAGTINFVARSNLQPGDIVTFKHHGFLLASKKPKFPTLYRLRSDLIWQNVIDNWKENVPIPRCKWPALLFAHLCSVSLDSARRLRVRKKRKGYWLTIEHRRNFFERFARDKGFDPSKPENWKTITVDMLEKHQVRSPQHIAE